MFVLVATVIVRIYSKKYLTIIAVLFLCIYTCTIYNIYVILY